MTIVYQTPQAELIQVRPNGGNLYKKCRSAPHFYIEFTDYNLTLKKALLRRWHHRAGILMDNDIGPRETAQNRLLHPGLQSRGLAPAGGYLPFPNESE